MNSFPSEKNNLQLALTNLDWLLTQQDIADVESLGAISHQQYKQEDLQTLQLDRHKDALASALAAPGSHFLGNYVERLWQFYLQHNPRYRIIKQGLQIHDKGRTLGEFDFIVHDKTSNCYVHQEIAIKFYLGLPCRANTLWFGPQNIDRLDKKTSHLRDHQLTLNQNPVAAKALEKLGITKLNTECMIKGRLFLPHDTKLRNAITYTDKNTKSLVKGSWFKYDEFQQWISQQAPEQNYHILQKKQWLSLDLNQQFSSSIDAKTLIERIQDDILIDTRSVMIATEPASNQDTRKEHFFVVPNNWDENAYHSVGETPLNPRQPCSPPV